MEEAKIKYRAKERIKPKMPRSGEVKIQWQCCWKFILRQTGGCCMFLIKILTPYKKRLAAEDEEFASEARQAFAKLEEGHQQSLQDWEICRHFFNFCSQRCITL